MQIPLIKPTLPPIENYLEYMKTIWNTHQLTNNGEYLHELERNLKCYLEVPDLALVANGTLALQLAIRSLDLTGEILTTPFTFPATTNAIISEGCIPVFLDIDPETFTLDPREIEKKITSKTSAILAVHTFGNPSWCETLEHLAKKHNLKLIFDAAHAFGVKYLDKPVLNYGDISILSFHATKVFNTIEGGAIISNNPEIQEKIRLLRNNGIKSEEEVLLPGTNAKMTEFNAIMGLLNLKTIDSTISRRRDIYSKYIDELSIIPGIQFQYLTTQDYNYSYMPILLPDNKQRDSLFLYLNIHNIKTRKYFYPLTSDLPYTRQYSSDTDLSIARDISNRVLCLPIYPTLSEMEQNIIIDRILRFCE